MVGCSHVFREPTIIIRFEEDKSTHEINVDGFEVVSYSIDDTIPDDLKNIWVSSDLLEKEEHINILKKHLLNEKIIAIGGSLSNEELYGIFGVDEDARTYSDGKVMNSSGHESIRDGTILYMYKGKIFPTQLRVGEGLLEDNPKMYYRALFNSLASMENFDKEQRYKELLPH